MSQSLMAIDNFGLRSDIGTALRTRPLNSGLFLRHQLNDLERQPDSNDEGLSDRRAIEIAQLTFALFSETLVE
jgi:hypothetical protein